MAALLTGTTEAIFILLGRVQTLLQEHKHHGKLTLIWLSRDWNAMGLERVIEDCYSFFCIINSALSFLSAFEVPLRRIGLPHWLTVPIWSMTICRGLLSAMLGIFFFPVCVVKTRMQPQIGGEFQSFPNVSPPKI